MIGAVAWLVPGSSTRERGVRPSSVRRYGLRRALLLSACAVLISLGTPAASRGDTADRDVDDDSGLDMPAGKVDDPDEISRPDARPRIHDAIPFPDAKPRDPDEIAPPDVKFPGD